MTPDPLLSADREREALRAHDLECDSWCHGPECQHHAALSSPETTPAPDAGLRAAAVTLREAAVKAGAHIVVTTDYPDGVAAFGRLCDAIDLIDAALALPQPGEPTP